MKLITYALSMLTTVFCLTANGAEHCTTSPFTPVDGQLVASGHSNNEQTATQAALSNLALQISDSHVRSQFMQEYKNQVNRVQQHSDVSNAGVVRGRHMTKVFATCNGYTTSWLLYETRSLKTRISELFRMLQASPTGPDYLLQSKALEYLPSDLSNKAAVSLQANADGFTLSVGKHTLVINDDELFQVIRLPARQKQKGELRVHNTFNAPAVAKIKAPARTPALYYCEDNGTCLPLGVIQSGLGSPVELLRNSREPQSFGLLVAVSASQHVELQHLTPRQRLIELLNSTKERQAVLWATLSM
jgi:hypothetical protein